MNIVSRRVPNTLKSTLVSRAYATPTATLGEREVAAQDPQIADYPRLPWISRQRLPAKGQYWDPQMRRNFGEAYHEQEEILSMWGPDAPPVPPNTALRWFSVATLGFVTFGLLTKYALIPARPAVAREYPFSGLITELGGLEENQARVESEDDSD